MSCWRRWEDLDQPLSGVLNCSSTDELRWFYINREMRSEGAAFIGERIGYWPFA